MAASSAPDKTIRPTTMDYLVVYGVYQGAIEQTKWRCGPTPQPTGRRPS